MACVGWRASARGEQLPAEPPHMSLVQQLGAATFTQREYAAKRLIAAGLAAKPALMLGIQHDDLEVRLGAHRILVQVLQNDFDARIDAFLNDAKAEARDAFPAWLLFRQHVGGDRSARQLYADMLRSEADLLDALDGGGQSAEQLCVSRIQTLTSSAMTMDGQQQTIPEATLATMLFVSSQLQTDMGTTSRDKGTYNALTGQIYRILTLPATQQTVLQETHAKLLQRLLTGWIDVISDSGDQSGMSYALQLVLKYDLREQAASLAREVLDNAGTSSNSIPYAAIVLGRYGTEDDAEYLAPHLETSQVFHTWSNPQLKPEPIRIQVRDVVLAMLIRLHGQAPESFGFKLLEAYPETVYRIWTFGFLEDSERDEAFGKWRSWSEKDAQGQAELRVGDGLDQEAPVDAESDLSH